MPVVGVTDDVRTLRRMAMYRGVQPILVPHHDRSEDLIQAAEEIMLKKKLARPGEISVLVGGSNLSTRGNVNSLKIRRIGSAAETPE
jgi:pyruvate kinase